MPPLHLHSDPPLMPSLHNYSAQQLHSHGQLHPQEIQQADPSTWIITPQSQMRDVAIGVCRNWCVQFVILYELQAKTLKILYDFTIAVHRLLQTVSTLMQAYHTTWSCEGCGDLCVQQLVCGVRDIGRAASLNFQYDLTISDRS